MEVNGAILEIENLKRHFGGVRAVDGVNLTLSRGRITALVGPNGAGKTTLFNLVSGFLTPDDGKIVYRGERIDKKPPWFIARLGIGRIFQDVRIFHNLTVLENVLSVVKDNPLEKPWNLLRARKYREFGKEILERAERWIEFVGLADKKDEIAENLSYGQQKLVAIARLLMGEFDLFLLDEPTAGVHPKMIKKVLDMIVKLKEEGKTIFVIEHNMNVVLEISDWVYFMNEGRIVSFGTPDDVLGDKTIRAIYLGV
ncbi:ABC transporter ATP-binding protein [bacterium]|nr:MAG: ABC transporter ATP-binding protein [bacterium]